MNSNFKFPSPKSNLILYFKNHDDNDELIQGNFQLSWIINEE